MENAFLNLTFVYLGIHDVSNLKSGFKVDVFRIIINPYFNSDELTNDIAIVKLSQSVPLNNYIQPACLPTSQSFNYPATYSNSYVVGWG